MVGGGWLVFEIDDLTGWWPAGWQAAAAQGAGCSWQLVFHLSFRRTPVDMLVSESLSRSNHPWVIDVHPGNVPLGFLTPRSPPLPVSHLQGFP